MNSSSQSGIANAAPLFVAVSPLPPSWLNPYLPSGTSDLKKATNLYAWNIEISSAFWGGIHILEVSLRNAIHSELSAASQATDWWNTAIAIHSGERNTVLAAEYKLSNSGRNLVAADQVVSQLYFSFWVDLIKDSHHKNLWINCLFRAFPNYTGRRDDLHEELVKIKILRNRIAHHKPIFTNSLLEDQERIINVTQFIDLQAAQWIKEYSRVPSVLENRMSKMNGTSKISF